MEDARESNIVTSTAAHHGTDKEFSELFSFLSDFHWIHDLHLTKFLESKVWNQMPTEWIKDLCAMSLEELNNLPFLHTTDVPTNTVVDKDNDNSLTTFLHSASRLGQGRQQRGGTTPPPVQIDDNLKKGMSPKKLHEVERMASLVHRVAVEGGCNVVVDVGSGLGYLGQVLHKTYGLPVIGLESSQGHSDGAEKRAAKQGLQCSGIRSVPCLISQDEDSLQVFSALIHDIAATVQPCQHSPAASTVPPDLPCQRRSSERSCHHGDTKSSQRSCAGSCASPASDKSDGVELTTSCKTGLTCNRDMEGKTFRTSEVSDGPVSGNAYRDDRVTGLRVCETAESHESGESSRGCCQEQETSSRRHHILKDSRSSSSRETKTETFSENPPCVAPSQQTVRTCTRYCSDSATDSEFCSSPPPLLIQESVTASPSKPVNADLSESSMIKKFSNPAVEDTLHPNGFSSSLSVKLNPSNSVNPSPKLMNSPGSSGVRDGSESLNPEHSGDVLTAGRLAGSCGGEENGRTLKSDGGADEELRVCLIGLHCCGDLTPAMLWLYRRVHFVRALCCVSCCYHKMQLVPETDQFINFPMSAAAKTAYAEACAQRQSSLSASASPSSPLPTSSASSTSPETPGVFLTPCSLRLAAQETRARWAVQSKEDHGDHTRHVAYRAVLELFLRDMGERAPDRRSVRKLAYQSFDHFMRSYLFATNLQEGEQAQAMHTRLNKLYDEFRDCFRHIEPYTCLQVVMQPVLEWAVLRDRQQWLTERDLTSDLLPVFDERISPRNLALVSIKDRPAAGR